MEPRREERWNEPTVAISKGSDNPISGRLRPLATVMRVSVPLASDNVFERRGMGGIVPTPGGRNRSGRLRRERSRPVRFPRRRTRRMMPAVRRVVPEYGVERVPDSLRKEAVRIFVITG